LHYLRRTKIRQDQFEKLQTLSEKLADVVLTDADPENWVGNGLAPKDLTQQERGDAYWCRKMAVSTLSVMMRVEHLVGIVKEHRNIGYGAGEAAERDSLLDAEITSVEKEANKLLEALQNKQAKKAKFDRQLHGKP
jgi:hypothetical protein